MEDRTATRLLKVVVGHAKCLVPLSVYFLYQLSPSTIQLQVLRLDLCVYTLVGISRKNKNGEVISFPGILRETIGSFHNQSNQ